MKFSFVGEEGGGEGESGGLGPPLSEFRDPPLNIMPPYTIHVCSLQLAEKLKN